MRWLLWCGRYEVSEMTKLIILGGWLFGRSGVCGVAAWLCLAILDTCMFVSRPVSLARRRLFGRLVRVSIDGGVCSKPPTPKQYRHRGYRSDRYTCIFAF